MTFAASWHERRVNFAAHPVGWPLALLARRLSPVLNVPGFGLVVSDAEVARENAMGASLLGWVSGCVVIWSSLFAIGNFLYASGDPSRVGAAWMLTGVCVVSGVVLLQVTRKLWAESEG